MIKIILFSVIATSNDFTEIIQKSRLPFVTISVNLSGEKPLIKIKDLKKQIKNSVDLIIDVGPLTEKILNLDY